MLKRTRSDMAAFAMVIDNTVNDVQFTRGRSLSRIMYISDLGERVPRRGAEADKDLEERNGGLSLYS